MTTIDLTVIPKEVEGLRAEFAVLHKRLPKNWKKKLAEQNPYFNSLDGSNAISSVVAGRARLEITRLVLEAAKKLLYSPINEAIAPAQKAGLQSDGSYVPIFEGTKKVKEFTDKFIKK